MSSPYLSSFILPVMSQQPKAEGPSHFDSMQLPHAMEPIHTHNSNVPLQRHEAENLLPVGSSESSFLNYHEPHAGCVKIPTTRKRHIYILSTPSFVAKTG